MSDEVTLKSAAERLTKEIEALSKKQTEIAEKLSDLIYRRDILVKAVEVLDNERATPETEGGAPMLRPSHIVRGRILPRSIGPSEKGKGMTASTIKLLSPPGKFMSVREILEALVQEGYQTKRINVYVMLKRLAESGKVESKEADGLLKYGLTEKHDEVHALIGRRKIIFKK